MSGKRFVQYHDGSSSAKSPLQVALAIGESGFLYIHDRQGYRRSSFTVGQMITDDVIHDIDKAMSLRADLYLGCGTTISLNRLITR